MPEKNRDPLVVVVENGRWTAHGIPGPRSTWLYTTLQRQGGIAESVEDGTYHYNVKRRGIRLVSTLTKVEK